MLDGIWKMDTPDTLRKWILDVVEDSMDYVCSMKERKYSKLVSDTIKYMECNFSSMDISLKTISYHMQVNAAHLGRAFRNETGEYFSDYLNRIRVERAKELLATTNIKVNEISEKVGFMNTSYFCAVFKKIANVSPRDYRA
jgi:two-component system response regulator YesN